MLHETREYDDEAIVLSVIIPVHNVERYLPRLLNSLAKQDLDHTEIIFVDDGSTDQSGALLDEAADAQRYIVKHQPNAGVAAARNTGLNVARGAYLCFIDPDDNISEDYLGAIRHAAITSNADVLITDWWEDKPSKVTPIRLRDHLTDKNLSVEQVCALILGTDYILGSLWAKAFAAHLFRDNRFPHQRTCSDFVPCLTAIMNAKSILYVPEIHYAYTVDREGSLQNGKSAQDLQDFVNVHVEIDGRMEREYPNIRNLVCYDALRARQQACMSACTSTRIPDDEKKAVFKHFQKGLKPFSGYVWKAQAPLKSKAMFAAVASSYGLTRLMISIK